MPTQSSVGIVQKSGGDPGAEETEVETFTSLFRFSQILEPGNGDPVSQHFRVVIPARDRHLHSTDNT